MIGEVVFVPFPVARSHATDLCLRTGPEEGRGDAALPLHRHPKWLASPPASVRNSVVIRNRSEEHTSKLQSRGHLVCRLLLEKKKIDRSPRAKCARASN